MKLGKAFSDSLILEKRVAVHSGGEGESSWWTGSGRALLFASILVASFFILFWRLFDLTVIRGSSLRVLADTNRTREVVLRSPRGRILDRTGRTLASNVKRFRLLSPCEAGMCEKILTEEEGDQLAKEGLPDTWQLIEDFVRQYSLGEAGSHVVGYTGEISEEELGSEYYSLRNYRLGDRVGRMGAEAVYEDLLRGRDGRELAEVDATGKILRILGRVEPVAGTDVTLSLDAGLMSAARLAFPAGSRGAVVASVPTTGEILTLFSSPSFSANALSAGLSEGAFANLMEDPDWPMFNRSIGGVYPPGSVFKLVTAIAALEEGAVTPATTVEDTGVIQIPPFSFPNWYFLQYGKTEGLVDMVKALKRSNDIYFYKAGEWLGITKLAGWARKLGVGRTLGIELAGEAEGLMPDPTWKDLRFASDADREARNNAWYLGDTYHVAIGQGYLLTTPLQVNFWTNVVANGGKLCRPTIEKSPAISRQTSGNCKDLGIKPETIKLVMEGMREACATGGTGWPLFNFQITNLPAGEAGPNDQTKKHVPVACKTGTAEYGDPKERTHAWFTVFAPLPEKYLDEPSERENQGLTPILTGETELSITVLVEGAGEGSNVAAPVAKKILEEWFGR